LIENAYQREHSLLTDTAEKIGEALEGYFPDDLREKEALRVETEQLLSKTLRTILFATKISSNITGLKQEKNPF
jgi:hypothetical protein